MAFFKGQETYSIDNKGRVNVPAKMRKAISAEANDTFVLTRGTDTCIVAYPLDEWRKYEDKFEKLNQYDRRNRTFLRMLLMWSEEVTLDQQQRVTIPRSLLEFAQIENKVTIVGMVDHIELWRPETFDEYMNAVEESYEDIASHVMTIE